MNANDGTPQNGRSMTTEQLSDVARRVLPPDPGQPFPRVCEHCGEEKPWRQIQLFGSSRWVPYPCECEAAQAARRQEEQEARLQQQVDEVAYVLQAAGLDTGKWQRYTIGHWDPDRNPPSSRHALDAALNYVLGVERDGKNWLFVHGPYGTGKTHIAAAIARQLAQERLWRPRVVVWPEHCSAVQESWDDESGPTEGELWARMRGADILVVDDLDKRHPSAWALGKLYEAIEYRYRNERPTIVTANRSLQELTQLWQHIWLGKKREWETRQIRDAGGAVLSRIVGQLYGTIEMTGGDQRWEW